MMTNRRKRRKPEQIVKLLQEGEALLAAGKSSGEVFQKLEISEATVKLNGVETKVALFVMTLPYSGAIQVQAFPRECTETFWRDIAGD